MTNQWKKMAEIPQEYDFVTWGVKTFELKVKQFVREYYITWLITQSVSIQSVCWLGVINQ